jgi:predicted ATPase/DNA-binding CsgD family transcriptional regulator
VGASLSGARIKGLRQALGLSQVELAAILGISNVTVNRWENDRARPQPGTIERLLRLEREGVPTADGHIAARLGNLPFAFTPLLGRAADLDAVVQRIETGPVTTVAGTAGVGKTRLAIEIGRRLADRFPDGVWFVDLAAVIDPGEAPHAAARALGVREAGRAALADRLGDHLRERALLLILDNCEHLRAACADLVHGLGLHQASSSRVLATSRVPLTTPGETVYRLRPLAASAAQQLFVQRAGELGLGAAAADDRQIQAIAEICARLDGLPLAIELAAARMHVLSVEQIAGRLDRRFDLLRAGEAAAPRQRTLETAIAWSYDLLGEREAALFRHLGVFVGWFDLPAVEAVCAGDDPLDAIDGLARQSLIVVERDAGSRTTRYRLLESLAAFARRALEETGEQALMARRHAGYFAALVQDISRGLRSANQAARLAVLDREHDNILAALEWTLAAGAVHIALPMASGLGPYWRLRGRSSEGISWIERALAQTAEGDPERAAALNQLAFLQYLTSQFEAARAALGQAIALAQASENRAEEAQALETLGLVLVGQRQLDDAAHAHAAALAMFLELGDWAQAALSTLHIGNMANLRGDHQTAERHYLQAWMLVKDTADTASQALILSNLGEIAARTGRFARALGYYERTLALLRAIGDPDRLAAVATNTAEVHLVLGDSDAAAPLAADAVAQYRTIDNPAHLAGALYVQAAAEAARGRRRAALELFRESLALYHRMNDWIDIVYLVEAIARLFAEEGDAVLAARLLGGAETIRRRDQVAPYPLFDYDGSVAIVRAALGGELMTACWAEGARFHPDELVAEAMYAGNVADGEPILVLAVHRPTISAERLDGALTPRQIDVLRLAAAGQSNREIGEALGISDRTVERHLTAIFGALGVDRRSAAVARAAAAGLLKPPPL